MNHFLHIILAALLYISCANSSTPSDDLQLEEALVSPTLPDSSHHLDAFCSCIDTNLTEQFFQQSDYTNPVVKVPTQEELIKTLGVKTKKRIWSNGHEVWYFDRLGNITRKEIFIDGTKEVQTYRYELDESNQIIKEKYKDHTIDGLSCTYTFTRDSLGRITKETRKFSRSGEEDSGSTTTFEYAPGLELPIFEKFYLEDRTDPSTIIYYDTLTRVRTEWDVLNTQKYYYNNRNLLVLDTHYFEGEGYQGCDVHKYNENGQLVELIRNTYTLQEHRHYKYDKDGFEILSEGYSFYESLSDTLYSTYRTMYYDNHLISKEITGHPNDPKALENAYEYTFY